MMLQALKIGYPELEKMGQPERESSQELGCIAE